MSDQRVLRGVAGQLVSYPRVEKNGRFIKKQPASVVVRIGTPAVSIPDEGDEVAADVDTFTTTVNGDHDEGADSLALDVAAAVDHSETTTLDNVTDPQAINTAALSPHATWAITVTFNLLIDGSEAVTGSITAAATTDGDSITITSQNTTYTGNPFNRVVVLTTDDLDLVTTVGGNALAGDQVARPSPGVRCIATPTPQTLTLGRRYLVTAEDGRILDVVHDGADADTTPLLLAEPLLADVVDGADVLGFACLADVSTAQTDLVGNGIAIWTATFADATTVTWAQSFKIVRRLPGVSLTPTELTQHWPQIRTLKSRKDETLEELIGAAWDDDIEDILSKKGVDAEDVVADAGVTALWALACLRRCVLVNDTVSDKAKDMIEARWQTKSSELLARKDWYDAPQDASPAPRPETPPSIRTGIRLVR